MPQETRRGAQRLSVERLNRWLDLGFGMFMHYGISTFSPHGWPQSERPQDISLFAPDRQDPEQWVQVARDAGMRYMILTSKHGTGFCLWPSKMTDYHVGNSPVKTDVIEAFVAACQKHGIKPGLYYAGPIGIPGGSRAGGTFDKDEWPSYITREQQEYRLAQIEELLTWYGPLEEIWFDGPQSLGAQARHELYDFCANLAPDTVIAMNGAWEDNGRQPYVKPRRSWPTDLICIEVAEPPIWGTDPWRKMPVNPAGDLVEKPMDYYIPVEANTMLNVGGNHAWFWGPGTHPRSDMELLGMRTLTKARNANLLLNCTPDNHGLIPQDQIDALMRLRANMQQLGFL